MCRMITHCGFSGLNAMVVNSWTGALGLSSFHSSVAVATVAVLPLLFIPSLRHLSHLSWLGFVSTIVVMLAVVSAAAVDPHRQAPPLQACPDTCMHNAAQWHLVCEENNPAKHLNFTCSLPRGMNLHIGGSFQHLASLPSASAGAPSATHVLPHAADAKKSTCQQLEPLHLPACCGTCEQPCCFILFLQTFVIAIDTVEHGTAAVVWARAEPGVFLRYPKPPCTPSPVSLPGGRLLGHSTCLALAVSHAGLHCNGHHLQLDGWVWLLVFW